MKINLITKSMMNEAILTALRTELKPIWKDIEKLKFEIIVANERMDKIDAIFLNYFPKENIRRNKK